VRASDLALSLAALPPLLASGYLGLLAVLARRRPAPPAPSRLPRIGVVVPAHDEEAGIADTVRSLRAVDYPGDRFHVLVVADNCRDRTAEVARAAGAEVLERSDARPGGKGHALRFAFDHLLAREEDEAVAVVDADTVVSPNLLRAFAARLAAGAPALQAHYGVRNPGESWRTRLLAVAFSAMHGVRSRARERLGLSCGLRGNGMCFSTALLQEVRYEAFSLAEDLEFGIQLGTAGRRVHYMEEAEVWGLMPASERAARSQRRRWERGRREIARRYAWPLLRRALRERSLIQADLLADLMVPPLSTLAAWSLAGLGACALLRAVGAPPAVAPWLFGGALFALAGHVLRGWALSGAGVLGLASLALAPLYVVWKLLLAISPSDHPPGEWVRTRRAPEE
jgi:cellulose synthase/poly-beta-1,6-N-acetylglucosamine synthase-like glycosyltransferase